MDGGFTVFDLATHSHARRQGRGSCGAVRVGGSLCINGLGLLSRSDRPGQVSEAAMADEERVTRILRSSPRTGWDWALAGAGVLAASWLTTFLVLPTPGSLGLGHGCSRLRPKSVPAPCCLWLLVLGACGYLVVLMAPYSTNCFSCWPNTTWSGLPGGTEGRRGPGGAGVLD